MRQQRKRAEQIGYVEGPKDGSYFLRYWSEADGKGERHRRSVEVGSKGQFRNREEANVSFEAASLRRRINAGVLGKTMGQVIAQFEQMAMPKRRNVRGTVQSCLDHVRKRWEQEPVFELALVSSGKRIEGWLNDLRALKLQPGAQERRPVSSFTKINVRKTMGAVFEFAMRQGHIAGQVNPIHFVRLRPDEEAPSRRQTITPQQMEQFFADPTMPEYTKAIAHVARLTGLRISEILGLKKEDFDLDELLVTVRRRFSHGEVAPPKSKKSGEPVPFPEELYKILSAWLKSPNFYPTEEGWIFASPQTARPYASVSMWRYLKPFGVKHGIVKFGWHSFRHSYKQYLEDSGVPAEVVQRLMRHARYQVTAGYGSGVKMDRLRDGQATGVAAMEKKPERVERKRKWA